MRIYQFLMIIVFVVSLSQHSEAKKKRKNHRNSEDSAESTKTKTKTKWSSSSNLAPQTKNAMVESEEHGYYVKRTFLPLDSQVKNVNATLNSPPFLAVPIVWFACKDDDCLKLNSLALNSNGNSLHEGYLCEDDCSDPYEPICGKTFSEVAVFYNKCKLNVAKCRSHGYWSDLAYEECKNQYAAEVQYAELKFSRSPYFRRPAEVSTNPVEEISESVPAEDKSVESITTPEQLLIQELKDAKPLEKKKDSKDLYGGITLGSGIFKEKIL